MKELRVQCRGRPLRVFYAFDPKRTAVLLCGGDKALVQRAQAKASRILLALGLAEIRVLANKTQEELALALGVKQPSIAGLERTGHDMKMSSLKRYVEATGSKLTLQVELADGTRRELSI